MKRVLLRGRVIGVLVAALGAVWACTDAVAPAPAKGPGDRVVLSADPNPFPSCTVTLTASGTYIGVEPQLLCDVGPASRYVRVVAGGSISASRTDGDSGGYSFGASGAEGCRYGKVTLVDETGHDLTGAGTCGGNGHDGVGWDWEGFVSGNSTSRGRTATSSTAARRRAGPIAARARSR